MKIKGVLDRIEDGKHGVILAEEEGKEFVVDPDTLPEGSKEGTWFTLELENNMIKRIWKDDESTADAEDRISKKMDSLRAKSRGSRFKRS